MELYLQCGYGMMDLCRDLIGRWGGGTVILSPRDNDKAQMLSLAEDLHEISRSSVLLDPQFYLPHSEHKKLRAHTYWPLDYDSMTFTQGPGLAKLMQSLVEYNTSLGCREFILPGLYAKQVDRDWLNFQYIFLEAGRRIAKDTPLRMTIALSHEVLKDDRQVEKLLEAARQWHTDFYYVVLEHPPVQYVVEDPIWMTNALDLCVGLQYAGARVLLGYSNQQMLIAACAKVEAIASGTWMNVRSFPPGKFSDNEKDNKRKAVWYYCPQALNEYKGASLETARKLGLLAAMAPKSDVDGGDVEAVFKGVAPSSLLTEPVAFRHFLHALRMQALDATKESFDATCAHHRQFLKMAEINIKAFAANELTGEMRDFKGGISANLQALAVLEHTRGPLLRRKW